MNIPFREDYPPRHDVVFSIMFGEMELFSALLKSVTGHVLDAEEVISQASVTPDNVEHNYIRFDTFAKDKNNTVYSLDLQNTYSEELIRNRTVYYGCRSVAGQTVLKGKFEKKCPALRTKKGAEKQATLRWRKYITAKIKRQPVHPGKCNLSF